MRPTGAPSPPCLAQQTAQLTCKSPARRNSTSSRGKCAISHPLVTLFITSAVHGLLRLRPRSKPINPHASAHVRILLINILFRHRSFAAVKLTKSGECFCKKICYFPSPIAERRHPFLFSLPAPLINRFWLAAVSYSRPVHRFFTRCFSFEFFSPERARPSNFFCSPDRSVSVEENGRAYGGPGRLLRKIRVP